MLVVEVGIKLDKSFEYYDNMLKQNGLINDYKVLTHDIYYTNQNLDGLSENEMKSACVRLRSCDDSNYKVQNNVIRDLDVDVVLASKLNEFESKLERKGYKKVFDTIKTDFHYCKTGMNSKVQLQQIENIGLLVYYDNRKYYDFDLDDQRKLLIDELNSYGFDFKYDVLDLDKLRTFYYKKEMYSKNQNG